MLQFLILMSQAKQILVTIIKVISLKVNVTELADVFFKMVHVMKENGKMVYYMEMEFIKIQTEVYMLGNGSKA